MRRHAFDAKQVLPYAFARRFYRAVKSGGGFKHKNSGGFLG
jgi:hypothetical protein